MVFLSPRRIETCILLTSEGQVENLTSGQNTSMRRMIWPKLTLTPKVDPALTSNHTFRYKGGGIYTKYNKRGISYAPDMELAQGKVNRSFVPWHDLENQVIYHEPKIAGSWNFRRTLQKVKHSYCKNQTSGFKNTAYSAKKTFLGVASAESFPMCRQGLMTINPRRAGEVMNTPLSFFADI